MDEQGTDLTEPVGRAAETKQIAVFLDRLASGAGALLLVEGEAGAGKSTLASWAGYQARRHGCTVLSGRSWERSTGVPYEPVVQALGGYLRTLDTAARHAAVDGLGSLRLLLDGLGPADLNAVPSEMAKARLHDAVAILIARIAETRPVLLVLDDLHWCDAASLEVLHFVLRDLPDVALGVLATLRPEDADADVAVRRFLSPLRRETWCDSLAVTRLVRTDVERVLRERLGTDTVPSRLADLVWARSAGTPLVVHELVDDLLAQGALVSVDRGWALLDDDPPLPRSLGDLVRDRVNRLDESPRRVLEALAVADEPVTTAVVAEVLDLTLDDASRRLGRLVSLRLARSVRDVSAVVRWEVEHPFIARIVEHDIDEPTRRGLHLGMLRTDAAAPIARRARHVLRSGSAQRGASQEERDVALAVLAEAGRGALRRGAASAAAEPLRAALQLIDAADPRRHDLEVALGVALARQLDAAGALVHLETAWRRSLSTGAVDRMIELLPTLDEVLFRVGRGGIDDAALSSLHDRLVEQRDWAQLGEVALLHVQHAGRWSSAEAFRSAASAVALIPDAHRRGRTAAIAELISVYRRAYDHFDRTCADEAAEHLRRAEAWVDHDDIAHRSLLLALEYAVMAGDPTLVDRTIARLASIEQRTGANANWRVPVARMAQRIADGVLDERIADLRIFGGYARAVAMEAFANASVIRYRHGPVEALRAFDELVGPIRAEAKCDRTASIYLALGTLQLLAGSGTDRSKVREAAALAADAVGSGPIAAASFGPVAGFASAIGSADAGISRDALAQLEVAGGGRWMPSAWAAIARASISTGPAASASELLRAAAILRGLDRRLEAADRVVQAAEVHAATVDDHALSDALAVASAAGASWVVGRVAALGRCLEPTHRVERDAGPLSRRERDVAELVARGMSNREVASQLFVSVRTVTSHLDHIYTKLSITSRAELRAWIDRTRALR